MNLLKTFLVTTIAALAPVASHAASITSNPSLSVAGLTFDDFTCSVNGWGFNSPGRCGQIAVNTITNPGNGIQFNSQFSAGLGSWNDATLKYDVSSAAGITSVGLNYNGTVSGLAGSSITERIFSDGHLIKTATVSCSTFDCDHDDLSDVISLEGVYYNLSIEKRIHTASTLGTAQSSIIDQTFAQTPEPGSIALMGIGLLAAGTLLRRRTLQALHKDQ